MSKSWKPQWEVERRRPAFIGGSPSSPFGGKKFLWGNVPAIDVLRLSSNEGEDHQEDLRLLFAASGDLRNVIKTIAAIPKAYGKAVYVTINDRDFDIVARNVIILLVALVTEDMEQAVDCIIHVWYSALVRQTDIDLLNSSIRPLIEAICGKIAGKKPGTVLGKTWTFARGSFRLVLSIEQWHLLLSYFDVPNGLSSTQALQIRSAVTLADERRDYLDRARACKSGPLLAHRICGQRFREDGILLPFGASREAFDTPNM